jgi:hypothetical protein
MIRHRGDAHLFGGSQFKLMPDAAYPERGDTGQSPRMADFATDPIPPKKSNVTETGSDF